jgi:hypothetical protein
MQSRNADNLGIMLLIADMVGPAMYIALQRV